MIWQNPWAWAGLASLAIPVLIHLLGRRRARLQPFPTLRFLDISRLAPTRRTRITDVPLLLVRVAILAVAVAALAQPLWLTADRVRRSGSIVARAIIVDTSASMFRRTPAGDRAVDVARRDAARLASDAAPAFVIQTAMPSLAMPGAAAWLATQRGRRELTVISDFQSGTVDTVVTVAVPPSIALTLAKLEIRAGETLPVAIAVASGNQIVANALPDSGRVSVEWIASPATAGADSSVVAFTNAAQRRRADAARSAAASIPAGLPRAFHRGVDVVFPAAPERDTLVGHANEPVAAWMGDFVARIAADPGLANAAAHERASVSGPDPARAAVVAQATDGRPVVFAAQGLTSDRLEFFANVDPGSLTAAALFAAIATASSAAPAPSEANPAVIPDATLRQWEHAAPAIASAAGTTDESDGRWFWIAVLALLIVEWSLRRNSPTPQVSPLTPPLQ